VSKQQGIEAALSFGLHPEWYVQTAYTYLDAEEDGVEEVRRPRHIASASLNWQSPTDFLSANLTIRYNGQAEDLAFTDPSFVPVRVTLEDYVLVNLNARVKLADGINAFGRVENLLDERYEQVFSFVSPGRTALIGLEARF
jgi:vitamin B12 transporter